MIAAQGGDRAAYAALLEELLPFVRRRLSAQLGGDPAADDVTQQVLLSVHRARHTFRGERGFSPWLNAIVRNAAISWRRGQSRELARRDDSEVEALEAAPVAIADHGRSRQLQRALERLPVKQREAIVLLKLEGLTIAEAARRAQVSQGAIKLRAHRGYRALRQLLGPEKP
ncbi:MAG: RNA polymerase sigma factor [Myxococcota bacterium]